MSLTAVSSALLKNKLVIVFQVLLALHFSPFSSGCFADEQTTITADTVEYVQETSTYIARGKVRIQNNTALLEADEMAYNKQTSETVASGNVRYTDPDVSITAGKAELNMEAKTGILYDAEIFYKKDNQHIYAKVIEKKSENYYVSPQAGFTTCDDPVPAWCFRGKDIDAIVGDRLKAKDVSFRIKDVPVLYSPYLWTPLITERKTGFLMPDLGYSNQWGAHFRLPFFWAISENRDITFTLDEYSKRGIGENLEYRYIEPGNIRGKWSVAHLRDNTLSKDFVEIKGDHDQRTSDGIGGYLNLNLINQKDIYREFGRYIQVRSNRFLDSTGEVNLPFSNSRAYLLSQYWTDLKEHSEDPAQRLPEAGYVLNPTLIGDFRVSAKTGFSNFWRNEGVNGQRIDIYPEILHAFGKDIIISQTLGLRETAYNLHQYDDDNPHREALQYTAAAHTRLLRKYASFTHVIEPSLGYTLLRDTDNNLPVFDSAELFKENSTVELSLLNRFINQDGEFMVIRATQSYDTDLSERPFLPLRLDVGIKRPFSLKIDTALNVYTGKIENFNSDFLMNIREVRISFGQRYNRITDVNTYVAGIGLHPFKPIYLEGKVWYDVQESEMQETALIVKYLSQCWGIGLEFINRPDDFSVLVRVELRGLTGGLDF